MDLLIVAFYTLCDDLLIQYQYQDDPRIKMSAAEVMTTALVAAELFGGNQQMARQFDLPQEAVVYADRAYCNYGIEDALSQAGIRLKPLRKKNSKRQYESWEVYLRHHRRKRVEVTNSLITQRIPRSIHAATAAGFEIKIILFLIATMITLIIK